MRIAIVGAGNVGRALGESWSLGGHKVVYGVRDSEDEKYKGLSETAQVSAACKGAEVVTLAVPWGAAEEAIRSCGDLTGKVVIDCTNPLRQDLSGLEEIAVGSGGEAVTKWGRGARVVKAFNTVGCNIMENPQLAGQRAVMFICGADDGKPVVTALSDGMGFETVDAGPIESSRMLESFALLWIHGAYKFGLGREYAFSLIRR